MAGVAAGLARYLGVDVMIILLAFVVLAIAGGAGTALYLAGLLLIPEEGSGHARGPGGGGGRAARPDPG